MSIYNFLTEQIRNHDEDVSLFECPICKSENKINSRECKNCGYELDKFQSIYFAYYNCFQKTLENIKENNFIFALESLTKYMTMFSNDRDAYKVKLFIYNKLNLPLDDLIDEYINKFSADDWIKEFDYEPKTRNVLKIKERILYEGDSDNSPVQSLLNELSLSRNKTLNEYVNLTNAFYSLYSNLRLKSSTNSKYIEIYEKFKDFFENIFIVRLSKIGISIQDFYGKNYQELTELKILDDSEIGKIFDNNIKKGKNGIISSVQYPLIKYHNLVLQKICCTVDKIAKKEKK